VSEGKSKVLDLIEQHRKKCCSPASLEFGEIFFLIDFHGFHPEEGAIQGMPLLIWP
jgi:hypothetical protein